MCRSNIAVDVAAPAADAAGAVLWDGLHFTEGNVDAFTECMAEGGNEPAAPCGTRGCVLCCVAVSRSALQRTRWRLCAPPSYLFTSVDLAALLGSSVGSTTGFRSGLEGIMRVGGAEWVEDTDR